MRGAHCDKFFGGGWMDSDRCVELGFSELKMISPGGFSG
jgi:hypothetical protein